MSIKLNKTKEIKKRQDFYYGICHCYYEWDSLHKKLIWLRGNEPEVGGL